MAVLVSWHAASARMKAEAWHLKMVVWPGPPTGTQLEPAATHPSSLDYGLKGEMYYLKVTRKHVDGCRKEARSAWCRDLTAA